MAVIRPKNYKYWQIVIYKDGKHHWISSGTENKLDAQKKELEMKSVIAQRAEEMRFAEFIEKVSSLKIERKGVSIVEAWDKFLETPKADRKERTLQSNKMIWNNFKDWLSSKHPEVECVAEVGRDIAVEYCKHLKDSGKAGQTYNHHRNGLRGVFRGLLYHSGAKENPWDATSTIAMQVKSFRAFTRPEIETILAVCDDNWKLAVQISRYTGLRFKDVCFLRWDCVDFETNLIKLKPEKTIRFNKIQIIPINTKLVKILSALSPNSEYVIPVLAETYNSKEVKNKFGEILDSCGIVSNDDGNVSFHSLRHYFVTRMEEEGVSRDVRQKLVGHGSPLMTDIYSHAIEPLREAIEKL